MVNKGMLTYERPKYYLSSLPTNYLRRSKSKIFLLGITKTNSPLEGGEECQDSRIGSSKMIVTSGCESTPLIFKKYAWDKVTLKGAIYCHPLV